MQSSAGETIGIHWLTDWLRQQGEKNAEARNTEPLLQMQSRATANFGRIEGLIFDMGDVLYDATVWRRWLLQLLARMGMHAHYRSFFRIWERDFLDDVHRGRRDYNEALHAFLRSTGLTDGQIDEVQAANRARKRQLEADARPLPGVRGTLNRLATAGVKLAVLSDSESPSDALQDRLCQMGLRGIFTAVVSSIDLGSTKPDPNNYRTALERLQLPAPRVAFVGHDAEELRGAKRAGMRTLAFNFDADAVADLYLGRFDELLELVDWRGAMAATVQGAA